VRRALTGRSEEGETVTRSILRYRNRLSIAAALLVPLVIAAILVPFRGSFDGTAAALVMVVVILAVAVTGQRSAGVVASVSAAAWFDFFLVRPYDRFAISHRSDLETTIAILVVGVLVTELAGRSRRHWQAANSSTAYVAMIHAVAVLEADSAPLSAVIEQTNQSLVELLTLRACRFERTLSDPPLAQIQSNGDVAHVGLRWPVHELGIPGPEAEILAKWRGRVVGRFVVTPSPGAPVSMEQRIVAVAIADVVAAYLVGEHHAT
jgi:K+-sensing histidine kinase KdpD